MQSCNYLISALQADNQKQSQIR